MKEYLEKITSLLTKIETKENEKLIDASKKICDCIKNDGLIYVFGCGHSHLVGLDTFYRAGGLANVSAMLDTDLMLHNGAAKSSAMEKLSGIGQEIFRRYSVSKKDIIIIISASGKNAVPIEIAKSAADEKVFSIGISSSAYFKHGGKLKDYVNINIDSLVPYGDACIDLDGVLMGGLSTAAGCFILNSILIEGAKKAAADGVKPPVYFSGNIEGGKEHNRLLEKKYMSRIKHL